LLNKFEKNQIQHCQNLYNARFVRISGRFGGLKSQRGTGELATRGGWQNYRLQTGWTSMEVWQTVRCHFVQSAVRVYWLLRDMLLLPCITLSLIIGMCSTLQPLCIMLPHTF